MSHILFDDIFTVELVDPGRYTKAARVLGPLLTAPDVRIQLDINRELFPVVQGDALTVTLASLLSPDGTAPPAGLWRPPKAGERLLADDYEYVIHGTVYKFEEGADDKTAVYVLFGGMLMCLEGGYRLLAGLKQEQVYLLARR